MKNEDSKFQVNIQVTFRYIIRDPRPLENNIFTEERKLEVPPRETLRMSDTLGYISISLSLSIIFRLV